MYNNNEHPPPHFHAFFGEYEAVFDLKGKQLEGKMPRSKIKLIQAWTVIHKDELEANWKLAINQEPIFKIEPLK